MHILYSGQVQGVGFRYTARTVAQGFEVVGLVRNLLDGRVELVVEGEREELDAFRQAIGDSGLGAFVRQQEVSWGAPQGDLRGFVIAG